MVLDEVFEHIYVINIKGMNERIRLFAEEMKKHQINNCNRFDAVVIDADTRFGRETGCKLSHCNIIRKAMNNNWNNVMIFEDDTILHDSFNEYLPNIKSFLDDNKDKWDMFYFGGNHCKGVRSTGKTNIIKMNGSFTTHCYAVNHTAYDYILRNLERPEMETVQIDVFYADQVHVKGKSFCAEPRIAFQRDGHSNILNMKVSYKQYLGG